MFKDLPFFPEQASTFAWQVDALYTYLIAISVVFSLLIAGLVIYFAVKFRRRSETETPKPVHEPHALEAAWIVIPFLIAMTMFVWGASIFFKMNRPPAGALDVYVVGKQWMWKFQHPTGQREINELHVPIGRPVRLTLASEDVIHSFYVPAFRVKSDVVPGRYRSAWFQATRPGTYHLFCAEYCGTRHAGMIGWVTVMQPADYEAWLSGGGTQGTLAASGEKLFEQLGCNTCHRADTTGRGPVLDGLFGRQVLLASGQTITADETYLRESIVNPQAKLVVGYQAIMPTFQGLVSEEGLLQLVAYIKELKAAPSHEPATAEVKHP